MSEVKVWAITKYVKTWVLEGRGWCNHQNTGPEEIGGGAPNYMTQGGIEETEDLNPKKPQLSSTRGRRAG